MEKISLIEALVKTSYLIQITNPGDKDLRRPIAFGSGFIINYRSNTFFVTADHNIHIEDHDLNERTGIENVVSVFNNISDPESFSTLITTLGGFYYMEKFNINKLGNQPELIDIAACIMTKEKHFQKPFLTDHCKVFDEEIEAGKPKFHFTEELLSESNTELNYWIFGKIRVKIKGLYLNQENTVKNELRFICESGDYHLFNTPFEIVDSEEWEGLSGSPVLNENGECVGVLCSVIVGTKSIFVKPMKKVKLLMDIAIQQEHIQKTKINPLKE